MHHHSTYKCKHVDTLLLSITSFRLNLPSKSSTAATFLLSFSLAPFPVSTSAPILACNLSPELRVPNGSKTKRALKGKVPQQWPAEPPLSALFFPFLSFLLRHPPLPEAITAEPCVTFECSPQHRRPPLPPPPTLTMCPRAISAPRHLRVPPVVPSPLLALYLLLLASHSYSATSPFDGAYPSPTLTHAMEATKSYSSSISSSSNLHAAGSLHSPHALWPLAATSSSSSELINQSSPHTFISMHPIGHKHHRPGYHPTAYRWSRRKWSHEPEYRIKRSREHQYNASLLEKYPEDYGTIYSPQRPPQTIFIFLSFSLPLSRVWPRVTLNLLLCLELADHFHIYLGKFCSPQVAMCMCLSGRSHFTSFFAFLS